jgi:N-acetylneuraminic acid mutarotase
VSWSDASGKLWLFGGGGIDSAGADGVLNDLWKFDPALGTNGEWTWMGGSSRSTVSGDSGTNPGVYGSLGIPASGNIPGGREGAVSRVDSGGNLWLFGGTGVGANSLVGDLNDLWEFDPKLGTSGEWAWMGGSTVQSDGYISGVYGTLGTANSTNIPGARSSAVSWSDASGNLWLFGGFGVYSSTEVGDLNDLWEFDPKLGTNGEWTWMGGSSTIGSKGGQSGVYGTLGVAASTNIPGGRQNAVSWSDASGNLWLFGGDGKDSTGTSVRLNDLWKLHP